MDSLRSYILRISITALLCAIAGMLIKGKTAASGFVRILTGVIMILAVVSPLMNYGSGFSLKIAPEISENASEAAEDGRVAAQNAWAEGIKTAAEAYILDKAEDYDAQITAEVTVSNGQPPLPVSVRLSGRISPYGKKMLQEEISQNLGIPKEAQTWIG